MPDGFEEELRSADTDRLIEKLDYCGYDPYYDCLRHPVIKEIRRRLNEWRPAIAPVDDGAGVFVCGNQEFDCGTVGKRNILTGEIERWSDYCAGCGCRVLWEAVE